MIETLIQFDTYLFYAINHGMANSVFDVIMPFITSVKNWYIIYVLGLGYMLWKGNVQQRLGVAALILGILIADPLNSRVVKEYISRERPCNVLSDDRLLIGKPGGKSFPSSHATNNFMAAFILQYCYRRHWWIWYFIALLICFSRVYVGAHYPFDVAGGAIEGTIIGAGVLWILLWMYRKYQDYATKKAKAAL